MTTEAIQPDTTETNDAGPKPPVSTAIVKGLEAVEIVPEMRLTVAGPCNNPAGQYVGLNQGQREKLGVEVGQTVELVGDDGKSLGVFTVGTGSKKLLLTPGSFTANGVDVERIVTVRARKNPPEEDLEFGVQHLAETADKEKHERRQDIILNRLKLDPDIYITIPTSLAAQIGIKPPSGKTIAPISQGIIKGADGQEHEVAIVPTGSLIGFTTKAAEKLGIPAQLEKIRLRIDNGKLVIA